MAAARQLIAPTAAPSTFAPSRQPLRSAAPLKWRARAKEGGEPVVSEDVLARLRAAEEETQRLRKELAASQAVASAATSVDAAAADDMKPASRIDGGDLRRETLFSVESRQRNWLSENDVSFFTGGGPSESDGTDAAGAEEKEVVKRRLLLGLLASAGLGAFALVPTQQLQIGKPSKPLFFYLVPLLRSQQLLVEAEQLVPEGDLPALKALLQRILGSPNNLQQNLRDAAACLPSARQVEQAESIGRDVFEYVQQIDYDKYYETMRGAARDGSALKQYYDFSLNSAKAAQSKLRDFLALMPLEQREAAATQLASMPF